MARTCITEIETSIKRGGKTALGPHTLIVGPNRSGKSTLVNGLEAAGSGRVSDVAGRATLAKDVDLSMLGNGESIFARATLSDGRVAAWTLEKNHRARRVGPEIAFPLREAREALLGEPDKARKWILRHGGDVSWDDVVELIPEALRTKLRTIPEDTTLGDDAATRLADAIDQAKKRVREANARAKAKPATPAGPPPTEKEIKAVEKALASTGGDAARLAEVRRQINEWTARVQAAEKEERASIKDLDTVPKTPPVSDVAKAALVVVRALVAAKAAQCVICGGKPSAEDLAKRAKFAEEKLDASLKADALRTTLTATLNEIRSRLAYAQATLAPLVAEEKKIAPTVGVDLAEDPITLRRQLSDLLQRKAAWALVRTAETEALQAEQDSLAWAQLVEALSITLGALVEKSRAAFENRVQAFLPESWHFGVDLQDGERAILRVGLRDGEGEAAFLRSALSGAEWATVTAALALATAPADGPVVIAPEERAFDPDTLTAVMRSLGQVDEAQVIITSPIMPSVVPEGWAVVQTGEVVEMTSPAPPKRKPGRPSNAQMRERLLARQRQDGEVVPGTAITVPTAVPSEPAPDEVVDLASLLP